MKAQAAPPVFSGRIGRIGWIVLLISMGFQSAVWAEAPKGEAEKGAKKNAMCIGCHGIEGYKTVFPEVYSVPKIGGQHAAYIVKALQSYRDGTRKHSGMKAIAMSLSDQDMADLAAYYSTVNTLVAKH